MKKVNKLDVWMISQVSAFLGTQLDAATDDFAIWYVENNKGMSELHLDFDKKELGFVDWIGDTKTYYALVGMAMIAGFTTEDYFTDKN
jgi:hypothetical protein